MERIPVARDIMYGPSHLVHPDMDIYEAMALLHKRKSPAAPVVDAQYHVVGILTEKDCLRVLSSGAYDFCDVMFGGKVAEYMSEMTMTLTPEMDLFAVAASFLESNFTFLPVVEGDRLVGCVSRHGMLRAILNLEKRLSADKAHDRAVRELLDHPSSIGDMLTLVGSQSKRQLRAVLSKRHARGRGGATRGHT